MSKEQYTIKKKTKQIQRGNRTFPKKKEKENIPEGTVLNATEAESQKTFERVCDRGTWMTE